MIRAELNNATRSSFGKAWLEEAIGAANKVLKYKKNYFVSVALVGEKRMSAYNKKYRKKSGPTDVLSFSGLENGFVPSGGKEIWAGEIIVCPRVAEKNVRRTRRSVIREMQSLVVHGLLHLFGHEHNTGKKEKKMISLQEKILQEI